MLSIAMYLAIPRSLSSITMLHQANQLTRTIKLIREMGRIAVALLLGSLELGMRMDNIQRRTYLIRKRRKKNLR